MTKTKKVKTISKADKLILIAHAFKLTELHVSNGGKNKGTADTFKIFYHFLADIYNE
jgi:hypothetical protein